MSYWFFLITLDYITLIYYLKENAKKSICHGANFDGMAIQTKNALTIGMNGKTVYFHIIFDGLSFATDLCTKLCRCVEVIYVNILEEKKIGGHGWNEKVMNLSKIFLFR